MSEFWVRLRSRRFKKRNGMVSGSGAESGQTDQLLGLVGRDAEQLGHLFGTHAAVAEPLHVTVALGDRRFVAPLLLQARMLETGGQFGPAQIGGEAQVLLGLETPALQFLILLGSFPLRLLQPRLRSAAATPPVEPA